MQVKKFEAPTIQEALDTIKKELGPEAIILQTKKNNRGFGLLAGGSVEVTAAISERSQQKKSYVDERIPEDSRDALQSLPAERQAKVYDKYMGRYLETKAEKTKEKIQISGRSGKAPGPKTRQPYVTIDQAPTPQPVETVQPTRKPKLPEPMPEPAKTVLPPPAAAPVQGSFQVDALKKEVENLKQSLRDLQKAKPEEMHIEKGAAQEALNQLIVAGVDKRYAFELLKQAEFDAGSLEGDALLDQLAYELVQNIEVDELLGVGQDSQRVIALVGPTGVGKTTTLAKIAGEAVLQKGMKVGLINLDTYKLAAVDQLATYAKILNVPFRSVSNEEELDRALADFKSCDLVLVDTAGRSQKDTQALVRTKEILSAVPNLRTELVVSASTRDTELYDMGHRFGLMRPDGVIFSKLDETNTYGGVYNFMRRTKLPLHYFTTGQRVPEDIEVASKERLASLILSL